MKNKKRSILYILLFFSLQLIGQNKDFHIEGKVKDIPDGQWIMLFTFTGDSIHGVDTTRVEKGKFRFTGTEYLDDESIITIGNYPEEIKFVKLLLEQGCIKVDMDATSPISDAPLNNIIKEYEQFGESFATKSKEVEDQWKANTITQKKKDSLDWELDESRLSDQFHYVKKNINNAAGKFLLLDNLGYLHFHKDFENIYALLDEKTKSNPRMLEMIKTIAKEKELQALRSKTIGQKFHDFELQTPDGEKKKLSEYVGQSKLIYLDFWASYCAPCIADMPNVKRVYDKYKDKGLQVISISLDDYRDAWLKALKRIDAPWIQLSESKHNIELKKAYYIRGIPYAILLNEEGKIIEINLNGNVLESYVNHFLSK